MNDRPLVRDAAGNDGFDGVAEAIEIRIAHLPAGHVRGSDFQQVAARLADPGPTEVLVRNEWMSLDPYMRLGLTGQDGYVSPLQPGDILGGPAIGLIEASSDAGYPIGTRVLNQLGWRSRFVATPAEAGLVRIDDEDVPLEWHLGLLGLTGVTAWIGIERVVQPAAGETIFISGAAGAVGSLACQLAKLRGARVLGSAGTAEKMTWLLEEIGVDAAFNHREGGLETFLDEHAPAGVDCYFDNVGGPMLETFLGRTRRGGRIGLCGAMSQYEGSDYRVGPANFFAVIEKELKLEGFNAFLLTGEEWASAQASLKRLAQAGDIRPCHAVVGGIEKVPEAFAQLFESGHRGKLIVQI
ncbi:zinc-binding dehydrogenase [Sphingomonas sp. ID0503]|uniref:zinc-binding dehydrogenase n=1 Tax=Sphingomonas sp. ID0503 TaxID=3399691 RepID=UPI003AFA5BCD